jgi:membrane protein insertase Oxa1/YidC/SpoIIIJ
MRVKAEKIWIIGGNIKNFADSFSICSLSILLFFTVMYIIGRITIPDYQNDVLEHDQRKILGNILAGMIFSLFIYLPILALLYAFFREIYTIISKFFRWFFN